MLRFLLQGFSAAYTHIMGNKSTLATASKYEVKVPLSLPARYLDKIGGKELSIPGGLVLSTVANGISEVVLDYGHAEGGIPFFETSHVTSSSKSVDIQVIYSETSAGVEREKGDGPFFLFSNAMDTYRVNEHSFEPSTSSQSLKSRYAQKSQRYQKITLQTPDSTVRFTSIGFQDTKTKRPLQNSFKCSNEKLNDIWNTGVTTIEMCTVTAGETEEAWEVTGSGTRIFGQHWAPCRQGTRWGDLIANFEVKIESTGASWGIHMVANGLVFCLDVQKQTLAAFEGLSDTDSVFPSTPRGSWAISSDVKLDDWLKIKTTAKGDTVNVEINGLTIASIRDLNIHPILGGSGNNTGSIAFGGPSNYVGLYRFLVVKDLNSMVLYENDFLLANKPRIMADFAVGTNELSCTIDGAKRDRACFAGDLLVMGRSIYYSTGFLESVLGSITLLSSHQTSDGYIGNFCPVQAPVHTEPEEPPTYAYYSLSYALALIVDVKEYMMYSGDLTIVKNLWEPLQKLIAFTERFQDSRGLIVAPPSLSMDWLPMGGPHFGASGKINLAYFSALQAMSKMAKFIDIQGDHAVRAEKLRESIITHLWDKETGILRMTETTSSNGVCQDVQALGISSGVLPSHDGAIKALFAPEGSAMPQAFRDLERWSAMKVVSPYASGFAAEALFTCTQGLAAVALIERVWGFMVDKSNPNYSGGHWEAMTVDGMPTHADTSLMHGWSTLPVALFPQYLAGLSPIEPGWARFAVRPVLAGLETIDAQVSTPSGDITVSLRIHEAEGTGEIKATVPKGSVAEIAAPQGWSLVTSLNILDASPKIVIGRGVSSTISIRRNN